MDGLEQVTNLIGAGMHHQVTQWSVAFGIAAYIHSKQVAKEIARQMGGIQRALEDLGKALRSDLENQSTRIDGVANQVKGLTSRVAYLESDKK